VVVNKEQGIMVPTDVWNMHFLFIGASGFGKTYNILKVCFAASFNKYPLCVMDGKADPKLETLLTRIAKIFKLKMVVWNLKDASKAKYNPFAKKSRIELIDMISEIFDYSLKKKRADTNIYAGETRQWITLLVDFLINNNLGVSLENLATFTRFETLNAYLEKAGSYKKVEQRVDDFDETTEKKKKEKSRVQYREGPNGDLFHKFNDLMAVDSKQLNIMHNDFEELYINTKDVIGDTGISIKDFMTLGNQDIILFQLASTITNQSLEKLLLYDFMCLSDYNEQQRSLDHKKTVLIIDEAGSIFQDQAQTTDIMQQFRSKQIGLGIGFQERAGVERGGKEGLLESLINN
jgi:hypothetical protein